jgi:hypothetical protein
MSSRITVRKKRDLARGHCAKSSAKWSFPPPWPRQACGKSRPSIFGLLADFPRREFELMIIGILMQCCQQHRGARASR